MTKLKQQTSRKKLVDVSIFKLRPTKSRLKLLKPILYEELKTKQINDDIDVDDEQNKEQTNELIFDDYDNDDDDDNNDNNDDDTINKNNNDIENNDIEKIAEKEEQQCLNKKLSTVVLVNSTTINDVANDEQLQKTIKQKTPLIQRLFKILGTGVVTYSYGFTAIKILEMLYPQILPDISYKITKYLAPLLVENKWLPTNNSSSIVDYITLPTLNLFFN